jgi:tRNA A-37 threonylcarbamoyl transferase component Bud32
MSPERFRQVEELYHAAREGTPEERAALLAETDPELRREVELLLTPRGGGAFLERPGYQNAPELLEGSTGLDAGASLGPYRIESKLGQGGMGVVFRAVDTRLGRSVAIKTTQEQFSARFEREARAIASLNHPNICTLHDVGPNYLVMELVEGETIAARLKRGPLPRNMALLYARQIAAALAEAHAKGIVHRDLKPGNIMIAKSGVKVLDFGLARIGQDETVTASRMVMGTPAYMSPEQREGKMVDARSDIYSFGCVLYEMFTGERMTGRRRRMPSRKLEGIVNRCLEEDPARRWQSVAELERELGKADAAASPWKVLGAAAGILAVFAAAYVYFQRAPKLTGKDTMVLADFDNKTGDPVFDDALRQGLSVELQQSPFLQVISDQQVQQTLALMSQPKDARLTPELAREICERTGSAAILAGSIASLGSQYALGLRATACNTGRILDQEQAQAARREDVLITLSQIARKFRTRVGESLTTVEQHSAPLWEATTSSLEALKAYGTAMRVLTSAGNAASTPLFQRTVEIDPKFAMAYAHLGLNYTSVGEGALARQNTIKAWQLRDRASDREKFFIDFNYAREVTGDLEKAYQTLELWAQAYPRRGADPNPQSLLAGLSPKGTGRWETVIEQGKADIAARPNAVFGYSNLKDSYFFLDRFDEAEKVLEQATARKLETPDDLVAGYLIGFLKGEKVQMDGVVARANGRRAAEHRVANAQALVAARSGQLQQAHQLSSRAVNLAQQEKAIEAAATYQAVQAVWEGLYGNAAEARRNATAALELSKGRDVEYAAALALGFAGDASRSAALAADLEKRFPEDTFSRFTYVPVLRALDALGHGRPDDSLEQLQITLPYELAVNGLSINYYLGGLHSAYVRGEAFLAARRYAEAAAEFQKILDHRGIVGADPIGALAHWQLGRAYALSGDKDKAKRAYQGFLTLWKDADPGIAVLEQAKAEYGKLQ